jgi:hypothetical protein
MDCECNVSDCTDTCWHVDSDTLDVVEQILYRSHRLFRWNSSVWITQGFTTVMWLKRSQVMLMVRLTCQPEMVTCDSRVFIKRCYLKIIKSGSYQQDLWFLSTETSQHFVNVKSWFSGLHTTVHVVCRPVHLYISLHEVWWNFLVMYVCLTNSKNKWKCWKY